MRDRLCADSRDPVLADFLCQDIDVCAEHRWPPATQPCEAPIATPFDGAKTCVRKKVIDCLFGKAMEVPTVPTHALPVRHRAWPPSRDRKTANEQLETKVKEPQVGKRDEYGAIVSKDAVDLPEGGEGIDDVFQAAGRDGDIK